ncbi:hypothetical protein M8J75_006062 [Diaphorina citri]|nr:hypothetical protein M8J75_006062 [Diaphorina citri]KAI5743651.1 hypothetical protein M8J77_020677 [Diaphorina citri]
MSATSKIFRPWDIQNLDNNTIASSDNTEQSDPKTNMHSPKHCNQFINKNISTSNYVKEAQLEERKHKTYSESSTDNIDSFEDHPNSRHSRKQKSKSSPIKSTDVSLHQTDINFSTFEKQFYPDFQSLEFLPEDILDPILMCGLPLGGSLDPYWSNLALEYFKSHEQSMKAKNQRPKKFNCPHCNVAFSNNGQLKGHIRIHTGERPYKCDAENCGKSFTRNEELTRHKRIHSGLRPYPCTHCGKKFGRKDHLKKHLRTHFPQPRYVSCYPYMYGGYTSVIL